jgi:general nucleoside transport system ATP-binding protein
MNVIEFKYITKRFGDLTANYNISFSVKKNSVHCLVGENGAGKSTLMKILFGIYKPDSGIIKINNIEQAFKSPLDAINSGIGMLHQHFMLIEDFTVLENVILGSEISSKYKIDFEWSKKKLNEFIVKYNLGLSLDKKVSELSISEQQKIEILKLLYRNSEIIIFDEPTAVLSPIEVTEFFKIIEKFKSEGKTIILITHKLNEVKEIADYVTVLRRGEVVYKTEKENLDIDILSRAILGDVVINTEIKKENSIKSQAETFIDFTDVSFKKDGSNVLNNLNLKIDKGEIYGICGVEGNGQNEIVDLILGIEKKYSGKINRISNKISLVPDDRLKKGMIKEFTIGENIILKKKSCQLISNKLLNNITTEVIDKFDVRVPENSVLMKSMSGGNQQKVIFAREIELENDIMVFSHPTRGVDINATSFIHSKIIEQRNLGKAVLLISSDLDELLSLSDRIGVLFKGKIIKEFSGDLLNVKDGDKMKNLLERIGKLMIGIESE